jgi:uncharacterized membrane protein YidH (DUF202 family)
MSGLFDPGLQPERTELAWRRTALAFGVGSLVALRLLPAALGEPWWALCGVCGLVASFLLWIAARRRYRRTNRALVAQAQGTVLPDGALLAALAALVVAVGAAALAVVLVAAG